MKIFMLLVTSFFMVINVYGMNNDQNLELINYAKKEVDKFFNIHIDDYIKKIEKRKGKNEYKISIKNRIFYLNFVASTSLENREFYIKMMKEFSGKRNAAYTFIYSHLGNEDNPGFFITEPKLGFGFEIFNYVKIQDE